MAKKPHMKDFAGNKIFLDGDFNESYEAKVKRSKGNAQLIDNGWIKADLKKPRENTRVFVYIPEEDNHVTAGMWDVSKKWVLLDDYRVPLSQVTYWRPYDFDLPSDKTYTKSFEESEDLENTEVKIRRLQREIYDMTRANLHNKLELWDQGLGLLEKYSMFLEAQGYLDTDWRAEHPTAIDEFIKSQR